MKKKILFLLILIVGFVLFLVVNEFVLKNRTKTGRMKVLSSPSAGVFVDNVAMGKTPFEHKLEEGEYVIKLIPEGVAEDTVSWQGTVYVHDDSLTYINRELGSSEITSAGEVFTVQKMEEKPSEKNTGEVYIETEPSGAIVYLDNDEKGVSPLLIQDVIKGDHEISVFMPGFFRRTHKINIDSGYRTSTQFKLALDRTQKNIEEIQKEKRDEEASEEANIESNQDDEPEEESDETQEEKTSTNRVRVLETGTGWLRVRQEPTTNSTEVGKVEPGEEYVFIEETDGWYQIELEDNIKGWVSGDYVDNVED